MAVRGEQAGGVVTRIGQRGVEARERAEQFADRRRTEALRIRAAEGQIVIELPAEAELAVGRAAERGVVGVARREAQIEVLGERCIGDHRCVELDVELHRRCSCRASASTARRWNRRPRRTASG